MKTPVACLAAASICVTTFVAGTAGAWELGAGGGSDAIDSIGKGVKELGVESMFVLGYDKVGDVSAMRASLVGTAAFRYFVARNISLGLNAGLLYKRAGAGDASASDVAGLGLLTAAYTARLGGGMFFRPSLGAGGFFGSRTAKVTVGSKTTTAHASLAGGNVRAGIGLVFYASPKFNLLAGPEALVSFGSVKPEGADKGDSFLAVDGGFNVGLSYVF